MSDKKINLIGKWNMGRLTRLPRQNVRQTLKKKTLIPQHYYKYNFLST